MMESFKAESARIVRALFLLKQMMDSLQRRYLFFVNK